MAAVPFPRITVEQYLSAERAAEGRHEYFDGEMVAMSGGTWLHALLIGNVFGELYQALRGGPCRVCPTELRVRTADDGLIAYPDIVVVCGEPRFADTRNDTLLNPTLLVEVLSRSTEAKDRGLKLREYRRIASLREYVLVSQSTPLVEVYSRTDEGEWTRSEYGGADAVCVLPGIDCRLSLADVYRNVPQPQ